MTDSIRRIAVDTPDVYAFEITGEVSADEMEAMARTMNEAFDTHHDGIDMLLIFRVLQASEPGSLWNIEVLKSRFRSFAGVKRYVVVGAPQHIQDMISTFTAVTPVEAHTFDAAELDEAWALLGARPT